MTRGKLNVDIRRFLKDIAKASGYGTDDGILIEILADGKRVWSGNKYDCRWWYEFDRVVEIEGRFIMFPDARSTRDITAKESGWEMNLDLIRFVKPVEKVITVYE